MDMKKPQDQFWLLERTKQHLLHFVENAHVSLVALLAMHASP
jgi:hypothetical protein